MRRILLFLFLLLPALIPIGAASTNYVFKQGNATTTITDFKGGTWSSSGFTFSSNGFPRYDDFGTGTNDRGVSTNASGTLTSDTSFSNVTAVDVVCSSNATGNTISVSVGGTVLQSAKSVQNKNNQTLTFESSTPLNGNITISVEVSSKTVWVGGVVVWTGSSGGSSSGNDGEWEASSASDNPGDTNEWYGGSIDQYTTWRATDGTNPPKYYNTGSGLRIYSGGSFTISSTKNIEKVELTFSGSGYTFSADDTNTTWTGYPEYDESQKKYIKTWDVSRTCRLQKVKITYAADTPPTPTASITVNPTALDLGSAVSPNKPADKTLTVTGTGLTDAITASFTGSNFITSGTLTKEGGTLTVSLSADEVGIYSDVLTLTSGTTSATVNVSASITAPATLAAPTFDPESGYITHETTIEIDGPEGATLSVSVTSNGQPYSDYEQLEEDGIVLLTFDEVSVNTNVTVSATASKDGLISTASTDYTILAPAAPLAGVGDGSETSPYNVARALDIITRGQQTTDEILVKGVVKSIESAPDYNVAGSYYIGDIGASNQLYVFDGYDYSGAGPIQIGDLVTIYGVLGTHNSAPAVVGGTSNYIMYIERLEAPTFDPESGDITHETTIEIDGPEGATLSVSVTSNDQPYSAYEHLEEDGIVLLTFNAVTVNTPVTVTATASKEGFVSSTASANYTILAPVVSSDEYELVTDLSTLRGGDKIMFVGEGTFKWSSVNHDVVAAMTTTTGSGSSNVYVEAENIVISDNKITNPDSKFAVLELENAGDGFWAFKMSDGKYLKCSTTTAGLMASEDITDNAKATISAVEGSNVAAIVFTEVPSDVERNVLVFNPSSGSYRFTCVKPTGVTASVARPQIFRQVSAGVSPEEDAAYVIVFKDQGWEDNTAYGLEKHITWTSDAKDDMPTMEFDTYGTVGGGERSNTNYPAYYDNTGCLSINNNDQIIINAPEGYLFTFVGCQEYATISDNNYPVYMPIYVNGEKVDQKEVEVEDNGTTTTVTVVEHDFAKPVSSISLYNRYSDKAPNQLFLYSVELHLVRDNTKTINEASQQYNYEVGTKVKIGRDWAVVHRDGKNLYLYDHTLADGNENHYGHVAKMVLDDEDDADYITNQTALTGMQVTIGTDENGMRILRPDNYLIHTYKHLLKQENVAVTLDHTDSNRLGTINDMSEHQLVNLKGVKLWDYAIADSHPYVHGVLNSLTAEHDGHEDIVVFKYIGEQPTTVTGGFDVIGFVGHTYDATVDKNSNPDEPQSTRRRVIDPNEAKYTDRVVYAVSFSKSTDEGTTGVDSFEVDSVDDSNVEWYTLQGVRVERPAAGNVYIRIAGGTAAKVLVK